MAKITSADVVAIRSAYSKGASCPAIGRRFGLHQSTVRSIITRQTWAHVPDPPGFRAAQTKNLVRGERVVSSKLKEAEVVEIRKASAEGMTQAAIARDFGVTQDTVWKILRRKTWAHVPEGGQT